MLVAKCAFSLLSKNSKFQFGPRQCALLCRWFGLLLSQAPMSGHDSGTAGHDVVWDGQHADVRATGMAKPQQGRPQWSKGNPMSAAGGS